MIRGVNPAKDNDIDFVLDNSLETLTYFECALIRRVKVEMINVNYMFEILGLWKKLAQALEDYGNACNLIEQDYDLEDDTYARVEDARKALKVVDEA